MNIRSLVVFIVLAMPSVSHAEISNNDLTKSCSDKTTVYGREDGELVKAGEKLAGYCAGFLQASLYALTNSGSCKPQSDNPDFLLSVYREYLDQEEPDMSENASATLAKAFRRIVRCE